MDELKTLYPGTKVTLSCSRSAVVYPIGLKHLREFTQHAKKIVEVVAPMANAVGGMSLRDGAQAVAAELIPTVMVDMLDLVLECTRIEPPLSEGQELAHWDIAKVLDAWISENFTGEGRLDPWKAAFETLTSKLESMKKAPSGEPESSSTTET